MKDKDLLKEQLIQVLEGHAHMSFADAIVEFPMEKINEQVPNSDYTPWRLIEHMRFTQKDILDYIKDPNYKEPTWPDDYWPPVNKEATIQEWNETVKGYNLDLEELKDIVRQEKYDLYAQIPGTEHTIIREILMVVDHNAYHIGEFGILRSVMKTWGKNKSKI